MQEAIDADDPIGPLAEAFVECYRRGDTQNIRQWAEKYPELAERIYKLFPTLVLIEELSTTHVGDGKSDLALSEFPSPVGEDVPQQIGDYEIQHEIGRGGRWIATGTWKGLGVKLWDAESGKELRNLAPDFQDATIAFSPDGKWLVAGGNNIYRFWHVSSWDHSHDIDGAFPGIMAFSPNSAMMAVSHSRETVRLVDPHSGQPIALLESARAQPMSSMCFSKDGGLLAVACTTNVTEVWNLREIRKQLTDLKLDWNLPAYAPRLESQPKQELTQNRFQFIQLPKLLDRFLSDESK